MGYFEQIIYKSHCASHWIPLHLPQFSAGLDRGPFHLLLVRLLARVHCEMASAA